MKADRVEISRDENSNSWVIRIKVGEEVIRRRCHEPKDADTTALREAAIRTVGDEGYTLDPDNIIFL